jgi:hypothetical protein
MDMHVGMFEHFRPMYCQCAIVTFTTDLHGCAIGEQIAASDPNPRQADLRERLKMTA